MLTVGAMPFTTSKINRASAADLTAEKVRNPECWPMQYYMAKYMLDHISTLLSAFATMSGYVAVSHGFN